MDKEEELFAEGQALQKQIQDINRRRFLGTWMAITVLALLTALAVFLSVHGQAQDSEQTQDIARLASAQSRVANTQAKAAKEQSNDIVKYLRGEQGINGVPGSNGVNGTPGLPGNPGDQGDKGDTGATGSRGDAGPPGDPGALGSEGPPGPSGSPGTTGSQGSTGATGDPGSKGEKGETGARGAQGPQGETGPPGPQGLQGPPGANGSAGTFSTQAAFAISPSNPNDVKAATAVCPAGTSVISGGFLIQGPASINVTLEQTQNNGWFVQAQETTPVLTDWAISVFALCV